MTAPHSGDRDLASLDTHVDKITLDAHSNDETRWAFRQALEDHAVPPCDGFVIGEPISVIGFDYDGNERRGLTARCPSGASVWIERGHSRAQCVMVRHSDTKA